MKKSVGLIGAYAQGRLGMGIEGGGRAVLTVVRRARTLLPCPISVCA